MYAEFNRQRAEYQLLMARDAVFKMIAQFNYPTALFDDGEPYIYNYCESALEAAFNTLGIDENYIKLWDFCQAWEDNDRALWAMNAPGSQFDGITADIHYKILKDEFDSHQRWLNMMDTASLVRSKCADWEALYINGKLVDEGHSLPADRVLECLSKPWDYKVERIEISDEAAEMGMPALLADLEVHHEDS